MLVVSRRVVRWGEGIPGSRAGRVPLAVRAVLVLRPVPVVRAVLEVRSVVVRVVRTHFLKVAFGFAVGTNRWGFP